jgi:hypothetical protein
VRFNHPLPNGPLKDQTQHLVLANVRPLSIRAQHATSECRLWSQLTVSTALDSVLFKSLNYSIKFIETGVGYFASARPEMYALQAFIAIGFRNRSLVIAENA